MPEIGGDGTVDDHLPRPARPRRDLMFVLLTSILALAIAFVLITSNVPFVPGLTSDDFSVKGVDSERLVRGDIRTYITMSNSNQDHQWVAELLITATMENGHVYDDYHTFTLGPGETRTEVTDIIVPGSDVSTDVDHWDFKVVWRGVTIYPAER